MFTNPDTGKYYKLGEIFKQPELLKVLQSVANDGVSEMYNGTWARDMVSLVKKENGVITMSDMSAYTVNWKDPINTTYHDYLASTSGGYLLGIFSGMLELKIDFGYYLGLRFNTRSASSYNMILKWRRFSFIIPEMNISNFWHTFISSTYFSLTHCALYYPAVSVYISLV